jgi:hypothetical protein
MLAAAGAALAAGLALGHAAPSAPDRPLAGTGVFIHEQEPPTLRGGRIDNSLLTTGLPAG